VLYALSPAAMVVVTCVGAFTALFAALMGFAQNDIKKVLAYSTVSQLGFMVIRRGHRRLVAGRLPLVTHAFFKACSSWARLGHPGCHHEQDIRRMGGLAGKMPATGFTFLVGTLAITGVAPLSGFFSKDLCCTTRTPQRLAGFVHLPHVVYLGGTAAALGTAFYMFRLYFPDFSGAPRSEAAEHAQDRARRCASRCGCWPSARSSAWAGACR
jgi:NADH-quinone oxidoreductase subunit L